MGRAWRKVVVVGEERDKMGKWKSKGQRKVESTRWGEGRQEG